MSHAPSTGESPLGLKETSPGRLGEGAPFCSLDACPNWVKCEKAGHCIALKHRAHETSVLMGCDAMRICMNMDPIHFPHEEVIQWMNNLRRQPEQPRVGTPRDGVTGRRDGQKNSTSALSANPSATTGIGVTPASDNAKPLKCKLQFNSETKKIDRVQLVTGLVIDSFDPPEECDERTPKQNRDGTDI